MVDDVSRVRVKATSQTARQLAACLKSYSAESPPDEQWRGPVVNRLWAIEKQLNPTRKPFGHADRASFDGGVEIRSALGRIRGVVDSLLVAFNLLQVVHEPDMGRFMNALKRERVGEDELPRVDPGAVAALEDAAADIEKWAKESQPDQADDADTETPRPKVYLTSWRDILVALTMKVNTEDREKVRHINKHYGGPIIIPKRGAQPKVDKAKLVEWWNGLDAQWTAGDAKGRDTAPTVSERYDYGRTGEVVPDIQGGVKKRRSDRKQ